jgi:hypothetical protein
MARLVGFEQTRGAFEPKDLLDAFPVLGKPVTQIRTTGNLTMLEPPMRFVPGLGLLEAPTIRRAILKQIGNILVQRRLIVLGNQEIVPFPPMDLCATSVRWVWMASKVKIRPLIRCGVNNGLSALISCSFSSTLQCHKTMPVATS